MVVAVMVAAAAGCLAASLFAVAAAAAPLFAVPLAARPHLFRDLVAAGVVVAKQVKRIWIVGNQGRERSVLDGPAARGVFSVGEQIVVVVIFVDGFRSASLVPGPGL
jgi:hypothetical protein